MKEIAYFVSPIGLIEIMASSIGICSLRFIESKEKNNTYDITNQYLKKALMELQLYFKGELKNFTVELDIKGSKFQNEVWIELQNVSYGDCISYAKQATNIGNPKAIRACANANAKNKIAIIIPCHRIIGSDGSMKGYAYGVEKKEFLLNLEKGV